MFRIKKKKIRWVAVIYKFSLITYICRSRIRCIYKLIIIWKKTPWCVVYVCMCMMMCVFCRLNLCLQGKQLDVMEMRATNSHSQSYVMENMSRITFSTNVQKNNKRTPHKMVGS